MAGLDQRHHAQGLAIAVPAGREPVDPFGRHPEIVEVVPFRGGDHGGARLAGAEKDDAPLRRRRQMRRHAGRGLGRGDRRIENGERIVACRHGVSPSSGRQRR
jgi:hypothetical protein